MFARRGHFLYWLGCGLAVVAFVSSVFVLQHGLDQDSRCVVYVASIGSAVVLAARTDLQILPGRRMNYPHVRRSEPRGAWMPTRKAGQSRG
jgi:hypothetical protein